jgi:hypothetical protein
MVLGQRGPIYKFPANLRPRNFHISADGSAGARRPLKRKGHKRSPTDFFTPGRRKLIVPKTERAPRLDSFANNTHKKHTQVEEARAQKETLT